MTPDEYLKASARTEYTPFFINGSDEASRLMHAAMGMVTESGEFMDAFKKLTIYGKVIDKTNLVEEIGDIFWYCALACRTLGVSFEEVFDRNIQKLKIRYPEKFTSENALNRDLKAEREALEGADV